MQVDVTRGDGVEEDGGGGTRMVGMCSRCIDVPDDKEAEVRGCAHARTCGKGDRQKQSRSITTGKDGRT